MMTKCFLMANGSSKFDRLSVKYEGQDISQLSITTFAFWNAGNKRLNKKDYGHVKPLISCEDGEILDYRVRQINGEGFFELHPEINNGKLYIAFGKEIGYNQGYAIDIIHTGASNKDLSLSMNFNEIKLKRVYLYHKTKSSIFEGIAKIIAWSMFAFLLLLFTIESLRQRNLELFLHFAIIFLLVIAITWLKIREEFIPYRGIPKEFHTFFNEIDF